MSLLSITSDSKNRKYNQMLNSNKGIQQVLSDKHLYEQQNIPVPPQPQLSPYKQKLHQDIQHLNYQFKQLKPTSKWDIKWDTYLPYSFTNLSHDQKDHIFQKLFQDYKSMKMEHNQYVQKYTILSTKLHKLQENFNKVRRKNQMTHAEKIKLHAQENVQNNKLKQQIKRLHQKISALTQPYSANMRPASSNMKAKNKTGNLSQTQKAIFPVNENLKTQLQLSKKHINQLLIVIDDLKKNKIRLQNELKGHNSSSYVQVNNNSNIDKKRINKPINNNQSKFKQYSSQLLMWKQKYQDMQLCFNRMSQDKDKTILELSRQLNQVKDQIYKRKNDQRFKSTKNYFKIDNDEEIQQLKQKNQRLENQLKRLVTNPLYKENNQVLDLSKKVNQLEGVIAKKKKDVASLNQMNKNYLAQLQFKSKQVVMLKSQTQKLKKQLKEQYQKQIKSSNSKKQVYKYDQNDYYRKLLNLVKLDGQDPVWKKYLDRSQPNFLAMTQTQLRQLCQNIWHSKLQLMAHLQKAQIQLKTNKQMNDTKMNSYLRDKQNLQQQLKITQARLDQWMSMDRIHGAKRDYQIYQDKGLKYSDSVSVFQDDEDEIKALDNVENFFDLYLGHLNLDQTNTLKHPQNKIKVTSNLITFLTVDFYNHFTQHSNFAEGLSKKLMNNFSFKVEVNQYFIKFLSKNSISLQLWSPQGTSTVLFGKGQIWLRDLVNSVGKDVAPVIKGKCPIYSSSKVLIGTIEYRMRMRLPISSFLQWFSNNNNNMINNNNNNKVTHISDPFSINKRKRLSITIQRGQGLKSSGSTFVYFSLQNQDFFTEPQMGSSPFWDFHRQIDIMLDSDFTSYIKQNFIQFTLFDDQKQVNQDVVGIAKANITQLLESNQVLDLLLDVQNSRFENVGKLKVRFCWM